MPDPDTTTPDRADLSPTELATWDTRAQPSETKVYTLEEATALAAIRTARYVRYIWVLLLTVVIVVVPILSWLGWRYLDESNSQRAEGPVCIDQSSSC
jgi:hypothetical protein